ncbi:MAG: hemolysin family protein [Eubacterium sp.]|nr:hemolysin family protein [Eubacterium sp.]
MDQSLTIRFICLIILIFLSGFFSAAETALTTANRIRIKTLAEEGNRRAGRLMKIYEDRHGMLGTILVGNNIVNLSASSLSTTLAIDLLGSYGAGVATFIITFVILVLGEISPKTIATIHAEKISLTVSGIIAALMIILFPIVKVVNFVSNGVLRLMRIDPHAQKAAITEGELRTIVNESHQDGVIEEDERDMIYNLFHFNDSLAKEIMVPRIDMISISVDAGYDELMNLYRANMLTRFPVYEENPENIVGFINMKDILLLENEEEFDIVGIIRTPYYTHEHKNTAELMIEMRDNHVNIAIVLDEYGDAAGMITMEDLLEEIVGEIRDEYDDDEKDPIREISENIFEADGKTNLDDINDALGLSLDSEDYDTLGGFVIGLSQEFPKENDEYEVENILIRVEKMENNRVERVRITLGDAPVSE